MHPTVRKLASVVVAVVFSIAVLIPSTASVHAAVLPGTQAAHLSPSITVPNAEQLAPGAPSWVLNAAPFVHISSSFVATLSSVARTHLSASDLQSAQHAIAQYNALSYAQRSNSPATRQTIPTPQLVTGGGGGGGCQPVDAAYTVQAWYGTGIYIHFTQCYTLIGIAAFAAGSGTAWVVSAICALSIVGNAGCSEVAGVIAATLAASGGILALWDATCNSTGVGVTYVVSGGWAFPSC